ncbi:MAG: CO dehydrogenase/CO-methylating acetyl-CoA synthase complex subunit beta [Candidatus Lokiarchaeota archaeon]|nr:CO dehydrogenase/CO-methylating acetyl-CoA synthase complex subunit beta [Candidatus Lokiarchaeota archaeon]MBD3201020.1 CO dehydrogenase/CO-methylating acetyl-CoA synthase complex subunit beta [Candidatus Lokiarchaeota archaeon]
MSFSDLPVDVGPVYEGERIRSKQMYVELGGPKIEKHFELVKVRDVKKIKDGHVELHGPDLKDMEQGGRYPIGILVEVAGEQLEEDLEAVFERRIHEFCNFVNGIMHLNQRYTNWMRVSTTAYEKGFNSLELLGTILIRLFKAELPIIEKCQVTIYTDAKDIEEPYEMAMSTYEKRDERARGLHDEDVDMFYGCVLCQSFAPTHVCCITPDRTSLCGSINWFDARAAAKVDPKGPIFEVEPGECKHDVAGEYTGINEMMAKRSLGEIDRVYLYSAMEFPHTSCGCFEAVDFYIPEVNGHGIIDRNADTIAINGLAFSAMANQTGGGKQMPGFNGISLQYISSPKFQQYDAIEEGLDGGIYQTVWMNSGLKERVQEFLPEDVRDKIATEQDVSDINELKQWLEEKEHPVVQTWVEEEEEEYEEDEWESEGAMVPMGTQTMTVPGVGGAGGFKIILKNCKIHAEAVIIKRIDSKKKKKK